MNIVDFKEHLKEKGFIISSLENEIFTYSKLLDRTDVNIVIDYKRDTFKLIYGLDDGTTLVGKFGNLGRSDFDSLLDKFLDHCKVLNNKH